ncbi:hypothetical protein SAMN05421780_101394 [Flexibacter flexilis DSM 6793]|uniref:Uncharacterized protein n=1 Tax=Flexibacter flexilis DSM 6793 TaxID=927664 RepID=A0A1I1DRI0_9BACT|nr:hypothetical protein [Flexibacter flexilis]SFB77026.1 hypothetical protein SAMN05421780_101394 [Flexibacter flexilis DSM 6793]
MLLYLYSIIFMSWFGGGGISHIAQANELIKKAEYSYKHGDFAAATKHYSILVDTLHSGGERAVLNLAHCYYQSSDTAHASDYYHHLLGASDLAIRSVANQQLGLMAAQRQDIETAATYLKAALKADPTNNFARHNYIKIKKLQNQNAQQQPQNKDKDQKQEDKQKDNKGKGQNQQDNGQNQQQNQQDNKAQQGKEKSQGQQQDGKGQNQQQQTDKQNGKNQPQDQAQNKDGKGGKDKQGQNKTDKADAKGATGSPKDGKASKDATAQPKANAQKLADGNPQNGDGNDVAADPEQLKKMKISAEKANMILESMRSSEVQYLQQRKHKTESSNRRNKDKPDW